MIKKRTKIVAVIFACLLILIPAFLLIIQTGWFRNQVRKIVIKQANAELDAELKIAGLEGNFWQNLRLSEISLSQGEQELLTISSIQLNYNLSNLLKKQIRIDSLIIDQLNLKLLQLEDSSWNIQHLFPPAPAKTEKKPFTGKIEVKNFRLLSGIIDVRSEMENKFLPIQLQIPQISASAQISEELSWQVQQAEFDISPHQVSLHINDLNSKNPDTISLTRLEITTAGSRILCEVKLASLQNQEAQIFLQAQPLALEELNKWSADLALQGKIEFEIKANLAGNELQIAADLNSRQQNLTLDLSLPDYQKPLESELSASWQNIDLQSWLPQMAASLLNGNLDLQTTGSDPEDITIDANLKLSESAWNDQSIDLLELKGKGNAALFQAQLLLQTGQGDLELTGNLKNLVSHPSYVMAGKIHKLDVQPFIMQLQQPTMLNAEFSLAGEGTKPESLKAELNLSVFDSVIEDITLDDLRLIAAIDAGKYQLDTFRLNSSLAQISASGNGEWNGEHQLNYSVQVDSLPSGLFDQMPEIDLTAAVDGTFSGDLQDWQTSAKLLLQDLHYEEYSAARLEAEFAAEMKKGKIFADLDSDIYSIDLAEFNLQSLQMTASYSPEKIQAEIQLQQSDAIGLHTEIQYFPAELQRILIPQLTINLPEDSWQNSTDSLLIEFSDKFYSIRHLDLRNDSQSISINGYIDLQQENDLAISLQNIKLEPLLAYYNQQLPLSGKFDLNLALTGNLSSPIVHSDLKLQDGKYDKLNFESLMGEFQLQNQLLNVSLELQRTKEDSILLSGYLPLHFDPAASVFELNQDKPFELNLSSSPFALNWLQSLHPDIKQIKGTLLMQASATNTIAQPSFKAAISLQNGRLDIPAMGIDYRKINLQLEADENEIILQDLSLKSGSKKKSGDLKLAGKLSLDAIEKRIEKITGSLTADKFAALNSKDLNLNLDAKLDFNSKGEDHELNGWLHLNRAFYFLPANGQPTQSKIDQPLLVKARAPRQETSDKSQEMQMPEIIKNLRGEVNVSFPRNIWLRSRDMYLELSGEIRAVKKGADLQLFGSVQILKGTYNLYGKRFEIIYGNIVLSGQTQLNPQVYLQARYLLIGADKIKNALILTVSGTLQNPVIQFTYNDQAISEADGVSYLIFGKSLNELSYGEKKQIDETSGSGLAAKLLARQLISKVTTSLQNELRLDIMEFREGDSWQNASLLMGKYITNRLFVSYQKDFSLGRYSLLGPEQLAMEYELKKYLSLQAVSGSGNSSGFNLIWKFQK